MANRNLKNWNYGSIFKKFSASLTVLLLLASTNLTTAALAEGQGGRGPAFKAFEMANPGLDRQELKVMFKDHWNDVSGNAGNSAVENAAAAAVNNAVNNSVSNINAAAATHLNGNDFASKAEFKAYKDALKQQNLTDNLKTFQQTETNKIINVNHGFSLDLSSAVESITLGSNLFKEQQSVIINVGGQEKTLGSGSKVTAAEYVAAKQALHAGGQSVTLDASGRATGGTVDLSAMTAGNETMKVNDLTVPVDVIASGDFGKGGDVKILGDLTNSGSINAFASGNHQVNALIKADNITNNVGANINSTVSDLTLQADNAFNNYGDISATGNLTVSAGNSLTNSGSISSQQNLNVLSPSVTNSGTLASTNANVNLASPIAAAMNVNNLNGTIAALNGAINVRSADYDAPFNTTVTGGDLLSKEVNAYTGGGTTDIFVNELTGIVNISGTAAHVSADTSDLIIGNQCLVGDPTYFNTGNIVLGGNIIVGEALAIIAGGNITTTQTSGLIIRTRSGVNDGLDINIIAGANITAGTGQVPPNGGPATLPGQTTVPPNISGNATSDVTFDGASATGGNIDFSNITLGTSLIDASGFGAGSKGGNITLAAFANAAGTGKILIPVSMNLKAGGNGSSAADTNGSISVIAGATSGTAIQLAQTFNDGGSNNASISIINAQPTFSSGSSMTFDLLGAITSGNTLVGSSIIGGGNISAGTISSDGDITIRAGGNIVVGGPITTNLGNKLVTSSGNNTTLSSVTLSQLAGAIGPGQTVLDMTTGGNAVVGAIDAHSNNSGINGGNLKIQSSGSINVGSVDVFNNATSGNAGSVNFSSFGDMIVGPIDARKTNGGGNAGNVALLSSGNIVVEDITGSVDGFGGNAGSVNILTNSLFGFQSGSGSLGINRSGVINLGMGGAGNGGTLNITNTGTGGIKLTSAPITIVNNGDGFHLALDAGSGQLDIVPLGSIINNSAVGSGHSGGLIKLVYGSLVAAPGPLILRANQNGGPATGGNIHVENKLGSITVGNGVNDFSELSASGFEGKVTVKAAGNLTLQSGVINANNADLSSNGALTNALLLQSITNLSLASGSSVTVNNIINATNVTIVTPQLNLAASITANNNLSISSAAGSALTMNGGLGVTLTSKAIQVSAASGDLTLQGITTYNGATTLLANGAGQSIQASGATLITNSTSYLVTGNLVGGNLQTTPGGSWTTYNGFGATYGNNPGTVTLSGVINFSGLDFAIISRGNIDLTGATINLDGASGGNLTMLAGFDFTPSTSGTQTFFPNLITGITPNGGGSVLGGANISTIGQSGFGGEVRVVANNGTINLGNIQTMGIAQGGGVTLIGNNGITVGNITTALATPGGAVTLFVGSSIVSGSINQGTFSGVLAVGSKDVGNLTANTINAGSGQISISGATGLSDHISIGAANSSGLVVLDTLAGTTELNGNFASLDGTGGGSVKVVVSSSLQLVTPNTTWDLDVTSTGGQLNFSGGTFNSLVAKASTSMNFDNFSGTTTVATTAGIGVTTPGGLITGSMSAGALTIDTNGDIGNGAGSRFSVSTSELSVDTIGSAYIALFGSGPANLNQAVAANEFNVLSTVSILTPTSSISAQTIKLNTTGDLGSESSFLKFGNPVGNTTLEVHSGLGNSFLQYAGTGNVDLVSSDGNDFTYKQASGSLTINGANSTFEGSIDITSDNVNVGNVLTANNGPINIQSNEGSGLVITGSGGNLAAAGGEFITVRAATGTLSLNGNLTFDTAATLVGQTVVSQTGSNFTATQNSGIYSGNLVLNGTLTTLGSTWFILNAGTFANNPGDITISGNQTFAGENYAIIASGNINFTGTTIDLSSANGGGNLTLIAGYDFSVNTGGSQKFVNGVIVDNFAPSLSGGSITGAVNINTSATSGDGGNVLVIANGNAFLGSIQTSGGVGFTGGDVKVIANGTVSTIGITTGNGTNGGDVRLIAAQADIPTGAGFQILNGNVITGAVGTGALVNGSVLVSGNIDTGNNASVFLQTLGSIGYGGTALNANNITISGSNVTLGSMNTLAATRDSSGNGGSINLDYSIFTGSTAHFHFDVTGIASGTGGSISIIANTASDIDLSQAGKFDFSFGTGVTGGGGAAYFENFGTGNITLGFGAFDGTGGTFAGQAHVKAASNITVTDSNAFNIAGLDGKGAIIELRAGTDGTGTLALGSNTAFFSKANGTGLNGDGGQLILTGQNITYTGGTTAATALELSAKGVGNGNGGSIIFITGDITPTFVGAQLKAPKAPVHFLEADASAGAAGIGSGGYINIEVGGNLTISDTSLINASPGSNGSGAGGSYRLKAGTVSAKGGTLILNGAGALGSLNAGNGGFIDLSSRSSTAFDLQPTKAPKNGVRGTLSTGAGGFINITNELGGIKVSNSAALSSGEMHFTTGGSKGTVTALAGVTITAPSVLSFDATGDVGGKSLLSVNTANLNVDSNGVVGINNLFAGTTLVSDSSAGKGFTLKTAGSTNLQDIIVANGSLTITEAAGTMTLFDGSKLEATNGGVNLLNVSPTGNITLEDNTTVQTLGKGKAVILQIGSALIPKTGTNPAGAGPTGFGLNVVKDNAKSFVFLGPGGNLGSKITVSSGTATARSKNAPVIFNNLGTTGVITLGNGSLVFADPPDAASAPSVAAAIPVVDTKSSISSLQQIFGFASENATFTSDLSVLNLSTAVLRGGALHTPLNASAASNAITASSASGPSNDDDNSYAVGYCPSTGCVDGAICSDSEIVAGQIAGDSRNGVLHAAIERVQHSDRVVIKKGNVLFVPFKNTIVETPNGTVHIQAKAIALVSTNENGLAVYDLEDQHKGSVSVESNGHNVVLSPGRHVMITKHYGAEFALINAVETIAHRNVQSTVKNGHRAHTSEFSLLTALDTVKPLKALATSKQAHAKQIADRMMKTTAIILQIGGAAGQYQHYFKPRMTAYKN